MQAYQCVILGGSEEKPLILVCSNCSNAFHVVLTVILTGGEETSECYLSEETKTIPVLQVVQEQLWTCFGYACERHSRIISHTFSGNIRGLRNPHYSTLFDTRYLSDCSKVTPIFTRRESVRSNSSHSHKTAFSSLVVSLNTYFAVSL